jgi:hypothetical protein
MNLFSVLYKCSEDFLLFVACDDGRPINTANGSTIANRSSYKVLLINCALF